MAINITKTKKAQPIEKAEPVGEVQDLSSISLEELADKYGNLQDQIAALQPSPLIAQFQLVSEELKKRLKDEMGPEDSAELQGVHWLLEIGACSKNPRKVKDVAKIQQFVGAATFSKIAKVNISDCEKYLTPEQCDQVIDSDTGYTENRKIVAKYLG